jgi:hypothetical protein
MQKKTWAKLIITIILSAAVAAGIYRQWFWKADDAGHTWGAGSLTTSERAYYTNRINAIIETWQRSRRNTGHAEKGRFEESYGTYMVIDLDKDAIWIEDNGQIQPDNYTEFPAKMKWVLLHKTPQSDSELTGQTRLRIRGGNSGRDYPEKFYLVGAGRGAGHLYFEFSTTSRGSGSGSGKFLPQSRRSSAAEPNDSYGSLIVSDSEYEQYRTSLLSRDPNAPAEAVDSSPFAQNKAAWRKIEMPLYQQIEKEVSSAGFSLRDLTVEPGPDFSAAHAELTVHTEGVLRRIFSLGGYFWGNIYLKIDYLGDDIWYAKIAPHPQRGTMPRRDKFDLEFLICPTTPISDSHRAELLEKGRMIQPDAAVIAPSKWKVALPNGATVGFIGICENPSAGKQWWGPDGSPLDYSPYFNSEAYDRPREDRKIYEMAWKVEFPQMPNGSSGGGTQTSPDGCVGSYSRSIRDRYGNQIHNLNAEGYAFEQPRTRTTLRLGASVGDGQYQNVTFENISLVPGQDQGFKILLPDRQP